MSAWVRRKHHFLDQCHFSPWAGMPIRAVAKNDHVRAHCAPIPRQCTAHRLQRQRSVRASWVKRSSRAFETPRVLYFVDLVENGGSWQPRVGTIVAACFDQHVNRIRIPDNSDANGSRIDFGCKILHRVFGIAFQRLKVSGGALARPIWIVD